MPDPFEAQVEALFADAGELDDAGQFVRQVERRLTQEFRRTAVLVSLACAGGAVLTYPLMVSLIGAISGTVTGLADQADRAMATPSIGLLLAMSAVVGAAALVGRYQASRT